MVVLMTLVQINKKKNHACTEAPMSFPAKKEEAPMSLYNCYAKIIATCKLHNNHKNEFSRQELCNLYLKWYVGFN
jgi:hypothetical protein